MESPDPEWARALLDILRAAEKYGHIVESIENAEKGINTGK